MSEPTGFVVNTHRIEPYKNYKFRIIMDGRPVLGIQKVSELKRTTEVITYRSGGHNSFEIKTPGQSKFSNITMERGVTHDLAFEEWAFKVHNYPGDTSMDLVGYKKDLTLEVMNEKGHPVKRYFLRKCWVSEYTAIPALDAMGNEIAIESIVFEIEGFERDADLVEPFEGDPVPPSP